MRTTADQALGPPSSVPGKSAPPSAVVSAAPHGGVRNRIVLLYSLLALAVLSPGIALRIGAPVDIATWPYLGWLDSALKDIRFGSGLRFWLGVAGATMFGLLLFYPLRKAFANRRRFGSVGGWFHLHIVLGIMAPVLILYHCNFGLGGSNANVALWTMLAVAFSGLIGQFVYRRVSANFYGDKTLARERLDHIKRLLSEIEGLHPAKSRLIEDLEAFDAFMLTPRQGVTQSLRRRIRIEERAHHFMRESARITGAALATQAWAPGRHRQLHNALVGQLRAYVRVARSGAGRAVREQIWARWRLFHLPLFLVMCVAVVLHIIAVWGMDNDAAAPVLPAQTDAALKTPPAVAARKSGLQQLAVRTSRIEIQGEKTSEIAKAAEARAQDPRSPPPPAASPAVSPPNGGPASINDLLASASSDQGQRVAPAPTPAKRPVAKPQVLKKSLDEPASDTVVKMPEPVVSVESPKAPPPPVEVVAQPARPVPATGTTGGPKDDGTALYAELQKRAEGGAPMMGLGVKGRSLADQIVMLKSKMKDGSFSHSAAETGFALTGKHTKVDCATCHQKPLRETPQAKTRQCIDCHKQDDIHRGRRPDCGQCHVPTRWSQILKTKTR